MRQSASRAVLPEHMTQQPRPLLAVRHGVVERGVTEIEHELAGVVRRATRVGVVLVVARCGVPSSYVRTLILTVGTTASSAMNSSKLRAAEARFR